MIARNVTINGFTFEYASVRFENDRLVAKGFNKNEEIVNLSLGIEDLMSYQNGETVHTAEQAVQKVHTAEQAVQKYPINAHYAAKQKEITDFAKEQSVMTETAPKKRGRPRKNPL